MKKLLTPYRIVTSSNCVNEEILLEGKPCQTSNFLNEKVTMIKKGGYVLMDFGKEIHGSIVVALQNIIGQQTAKVRIVYGESVMEALSSIGEKNATNDHSPRDFVAEMVMMSAVPYGETGFRFVKIQPLDADITLCSVKAKLQIRDVQYQGKFECDDNRLNQIWETAAYTVQLNMQEYLWDGIKRDRLVWIGDMHPEVSTIRYVFGKDECVPRSLDFIKQTTSANSWMNNIPTYSMWWIIIQHDWYLHWGDMEYLKEQADYLKKVVCKAFQWIDSDFEESGLDLEYFVDWPNKGREGEKEGTKAIFCMAMGCAARLFDALGDDTYRELCSKYEEVLKSQDLKTDISRSISALMVLSGKNEHKAIEKVLNPSLNDISTFMGFYLLRAKAQLGHLGDALKMIREYWGAMLDLGATTFWEDFDISWKENAARIDEITPEGKADVHGDFGKYCYKQFRHSLCHGWASGPASFLIEQVAGIKILEPGCKRIRISPNLGGLKWANITFPTPYGGIAMKLKEEQGKTIYEITAPEEITIVRE